MTTNKVHDPKNTECHLNHPLHSENSMLACKPEWRCHCTCEKQQQAPQEPTPTSVTWKSKCCNETLKLIVADFITKGGEKSSQCPRCQKQCEITESVTGEEWVERFEKNLMLPMKCKYSSDDVDNCVASINWKFIEDDVRKFIRSELLAQRTHIKQALLGRSKKLKRKYSNDLALDENNLIHKLETVDDTELFINEELA